MPTRPADQTEYIVLGISLIVTALFGYLGYLEYGENKKLQKQLASETGNINTQKQEVKELHDRLVNVSSALGWRSRHVQVSQTEGEKRSGKLEGYPSIDSLENNNRIVDYTRSLMERQGYTNEEISQQTASTSKARQFLTDFYRSNLRRTNASLTDPVALSRDLNHTHAIVPVIDHSPVSSDTLSTHKSNDKKWSYTEPENGLEELTDSSNSPGTTLTEVLNELTRIRNELASEVDRLESDISQTRQTVYSYVADVGDEAQIPAFLEKSKQEISNLQQQIEDLTSSVHNKEEQLVSVKGESDQKQFQKRREQSELLDQQNQELIKKKNQITKLEQRLKELQNSKSGIETDPDAVDGEVLSSNQNASVAFIDIGRSHGLFVGREFEVFNTIKGGREVVKGRIKVVELFDNYARAKIISQENPQNNPISSNDFVRSEQFSRGQTKTFVFVGTFSGNYNKTVLKEMVLDNGHQVKQEVTINTDYVVIGSGYEQHPSFQKAKELNVNTISSSNLRHLFNSN